MSRPAAASAKRTSHWPSGAGGAGRGGFAPGRQATAAVQHPSAPPSPHTRNGAHACPTPNHGSATSNSPTTSEPSRSPATPSAPHSSDTSTRPNSPTPLKLFASELFSNSVKHSDGPVTVRLRSRGTAVRVGVMDNHPELPDPLPCTHGPGLRSRPVPGGVAGGRVGPLSGGPGDQSLPCAWLEGGVVRAVRLRTEVRPAEVRRSGPLRGAAARPASCFSAAELSPPPRTSRHTLRAAAPCTAPADGTPYPRERSSRGLRTHPKPAR